MKFRIAGWGAVAVSAMAAALAGASLASSTPSAAVSAPAAAAARGQDDAGGRGDRPEATSPTAYDFGETLARLEGERLEITFLAEIIPHHRAAIEMARLELERGTSADIRTHAENIIASQQHQVDQFTRWLEEWYGLTPEEAMARAPAEARHEMARMERETRQDLAELRGVPAGEAFDVAFVKKIIPHHSAGIIEFLEPQSRAVHPQLRVAAATGITQQEAEIADFRTWLSARAE